jgi:type I restriction-modification system DNA methylase subunit
VILTNPPFGGKEGKDAQKNFPFETSATQVLFLQDILAELATGGTCAMVLDEGLLFRTNESAFVETKRKLVDECDLWAIVSLPGGVFSTAGAGVKTNLLFFTKGKKTETHLVLRPVAGEGGQEDPADVGALWLCSNRSVVRRCGPACFLGGGVAG